MKSATAVLVCALFACSASPSEPPRASVSGVGAPQADFARYRTFVFGPSNAPAPGYTVTARSLEVQRRLTPLVQASLERRGYVPSRNGDFVIKISSGSGTIEGEKMHRADPPDTTAGFIGIDAYDRSTGAAIWHGTAFAEIDPSRIDDRLLARGVERMLKDFPARPATSEVASSTQQKRHE